MALTTVIDLVLVAIIVICAWQGYKKGIIMGMIGVLVIILSVYGAQLLSDTYSYEVIPVLKPFASGLMDSRVEQTAYEVLGYEADEEGEYHVDLSLADMLQAQPESRKEIARWVYRGLGVYDELAEDMADKAVAYAEQNNADLRSAVVTILCQSITWYGGFILAFIILFAVLTVVVNIPNLSFRIPYVGIVNDLGGLAIGVFTGALFCAILVWLLQFTGLLIPEEALRASGVAGYFMDRNLLANYISF